MHALALRAAGRERPFQCRQRRGAQLPRPGRCGLSRAGARAEWSEYHRHARADPRATISTSPRRGWSGCASAGYDRAATLARRGRAPTTCKPISPPPTPIAEAMRTPLYNPLSLRRRSAHRAGDPSAGDRELRTVRAGHPLVRARLYRGAAARLALLPGAGAEGRRLDGGAAGHRRFPRLGDARRRARRPASAMCCSTTRLLLRRIRSRSCRCGTAACRSTAARSACTSRIIIFCREAQAAALGDRPTSIACAVPIGLFFGRIANFINGELWGRADRRALGDGRSPTGGPVPRHPSQLYEATSKASCCSSSCICCSARTRFGRGRGVLTGVFLIGYACARIICEFFREPDAQSRLPLWRRDDGPAPVAAGAGLRPLPRAGTHRPNARQ